MAASGVAVFFDGRTSLRQHVHVELADALLIIRPDGARLDSWPLDEIRALASRPGVLRLTREGGPALARLEIDDSAFAAVVRGAARRLDASRAAEAGTARKVVLWSLAAVVSLTLFGLYGIPALAERVTPLLPWSVDQRMGREADRQIRGFIETRPGPFACGEGSEERPGRDALDRLAKRLSDAAALPVPIEIIAVRSDFVNALALPGGLIYLFDGLIQHAARGDEIVAVLAHEVGHAANRDGTRHALQAGGASLLFGFVLGDFVGGTAAIAVLRVLSEASYSRAAETDADAYSVALMRRLGGDPRALSEMLSRLTEDDEADADPNDRDRSGAATIGRWIESHPATGDRRRAIGAIAGDGPTAPVMDDADFLALKRICGSGS